MHDDDKIGKEITEPVVEFIRSTNSYNTTRYTTRCPVIIFASLVNITGISFIIIYKANYPTENVIRRNYVEKLALETCRKQPATNKNVQKVITRYAHEEKIGRQHIDVKIMCKNILEEH